MSEAQLHRAGTVHGCATRALTCKKLLRGRWTIHRSFVRHRWRLCSPWRHVRRHTPTPNADLDLPGWLPHVTTHAHVTPSRSRNGAIMRFRCRKRTTVTKRVLNSSQEIKLKQKHPPYPPPTHKTLSSTIPRHHPSPQGESVGPPPPKGVTTTSNTDIQQKKRNLPTHPGKRGSRCGFLLRGV